MVLQVGQAGPLLLPRHANSSAVFTEGPAALSRDGGGRWAFFTVLYARLVQSMVVSGLQEGKSGCSKASRSRGSGGTQYPLFSVGQINSQGKPTVTGWRPVPQVRTQTRGSALQQGLFLWQSPHNIYLCMEMCECMHKMIFLHLNLKSWYLLYKFIYINVVES